MNVFLTVLAIMFSLAWYGISVLLFLVVYHQIFYPVLVTSFFVEYAHDLWDISFENVA